jgi:hypothetical protein
MAAKLKAPSFAGEASLLPHGVSAKQDMPPSHSALVPLGQGLAVSQFSTSSPQEAPQKNLDVTSSTAVSAAVLSRLSFSLAPMRGVQTVGVGEESESESLPPVGFASGDGSSSGDCSSDLQGVPLKHCFFPGQSESFVD